MFTKKRNKKICPQGNVSTFQPKVTIKYPKDFDPITGTIAITFTSTWKCVFKFSVKCSAS